MASNRSLSPSQRATRDRIDSAYAQISQAGNLAAPSKAELRASIPAYDESMVKRVVVPPKGKKKSSPK